MFKVLLVELTRTYNLGEIWTYKTLNSMFNQILKCSQELLSIVNIFIRLELKLQDEINKAYIIWLPNFLPRCQEDFSLKAYPSIDRNTAFA